MNEEILRLEENILYWTGKMNRLKKHATELDYIMDNFYKSKKPSHIKIMQERMLPVYHYFTDKICDINMKIELSRNVLRRKNPKRGKISSPEKEEPQTPHFMIPHPQSPKKD